MLLSLMVDEIIEHSLWLMIKMAAEAAFQCLCFLAIDLGCGGFTDFCHVSKANVCLIIDGIGRQAHDVVRVGVVEHIGLVVQ